MRPSARVVIVFAVLVASVAGSGAETAVGAEADATTLRPAAAPCDSHYWPCVPPAPPVLTCAAIGHKVWIVGFADGHDLDFPDRDGVACEHLPDPLIGLPSDNPLPHEPPAFPIPGLVPAPAPERCLWGSFTSLRVTGPPTPAISRFVPLSTPARLFDTRAIGDDGYICPRRTMIQRVAGHAGVPADAVAVVLNVTGVLPTGAGYVTVYPAGAPRPDASSLNFTEAYQQRANLVTVPLGADGAVSFYADVGAHLIVDVAGYFEAAPSSASGRLTPVQPARLLDTRVGNGAAASKPGAGAILDFAVAGRGGVPASGAQAVVLNVTAADATAGGFVTVWPTGRPLPNASNLNLAGPHDTAPNLVIVPLGADGKVSIFTEAGTHLIADVFGWFGDVTQPVSASGLFVPITPTRVFDTRAGARLAGGDIITQAHAGSPAVRAVAFNLTATQAAAPGYVTAWPAGTARPDVSSLNLMREGDTRANAAIVPVGEGGSISYYTEAGTHLLADAAGYFS